MFTDTRTETSIEQSFEVGAEPRFTIRGVSGRIAIQSGSAGSIQVRAVKYGDDQAVEHTQVTFEQVGDHVRVETRTDKGRGFRLQRSMCAVNYTVTVPEGCQVEAHGVSSEIHLAGTHAPASLHTVSGDVEVLGVRGDCRLHAVSGSVRVIGVEGTLHAHAVSGDLLIRDGRLDNFEVQTVSGTADIATPLIAGEIYRAHSVSGDLRLHVPSSTGATVCLKTVSGALRSQIPMDMRQSGRRHWEGVLNGGGAQVEMESVSGTLTIEAVSDGETTMPVNDDHHEARTEVLDALQRGDISVEEASTRLYALR